MLYLFVSKYTTTSSKSQYFLAKKFKKNHLMKLIVYKLNS